MLLLLKNIIFTIIFPGAVGIYLPLYLVGQSKKLLWQPWSILQIVALIPMITGAVIYFWCLWNFMIKGKGTPLPIDAPKSLVVQGLYRYIRNPMYVGVLLVIAGWAIFFWTINLLVYGIAVWIIFHLFALVIEEPILKRKFGSDYEEYCRNVGRWLPKNSKGNII
jgi:protein-S-isoprenylcysteine O-methyltransferase Ste14